MQVGGRVQTKRRGTKNDRMKRLVYRAALVLCFTVPIALIALQARQERIERKFQYDECQHTLRQLDAAKEQVLMDGRIPMGYKPTWREVRLCIRKWPLACLLGGKYTLGGAGVDPSCSVHGPLVDGTPSP